MRPHVDLAAARGRANLVLTNLVAAGFLTEGQVTAARRHPGVADRPHRRGQFAQLFPRLGLRADQDDRRGQPSHLEQFRRPHHHRFRCCRPMPRTRSPRWCASRASNTTSSQAAMVVTDTNGRRARHGGRHRLRQEPVQPRHRLHPPARLGLQDLRLFRGLRAIGPQRRPTPSPTAPSASATGARRTTAATTRARSRWKAPSPSRSIPCR